MALWRSWPKAGTGRAEKELHCQVRVRRATEDAPGECNAHTDNPEGSSVTMPEQAGSTEYTKSVRWALAHPKLGQCCREGEEEAQLSGCKCKV